MLKKNISILFKHPSWKASYVIFLYVVILCFLQLSISSTHAHFKKQTNKIYYFLSLPVRVQHSQEDTGRPWYLFRTGQDNFIFSQPYYKYTLSFNICAMTRVTDGFLYSIDNTVVWHRQHSRTCLCHPISLSQYSKCNLTSTAKGRFTGICKNLHIISVWYIWHDSYWENDLLRKV